MSSLEGWTPAITDAESLALVVERAFDYRGDVTIVRRDGGTLVGYVANRDRHRSEPFVDVLPADGSAAVRIRYADIARIAFTGKDTAAGNSYAAWLRRKQADGAREGALGAREGPLGARKGDPGDTPVRGV